MIDARAVVTTVCTQAGTWTSEQRRIPSRRKWFFHRSGGCLRSKVQSDCQCFVGVRHSPITWLTAFESLAGNQSPIALPRRPLWAVAVTAKATANDSRCDYVETVSRNCVTKLIPVHGVSMWEGNWLPDWRIRTHFSIFGGMRGSLDWLFDFISNISKEVLEFFASREFTYGTQKNQLQKIK